MSKGGSGNGSGGGSGGRGWKWGERKMGGDRGKGGRERWAGCTLIEG